MFVLVTGASGQLGKSLNRFVENNILNHQFVFATREQLDLSNFKNVRRFIEKNQFNIIIVEDDFEPCLAWRLLIHKTLRVVQRLRSLRW